MTVVGSTHAQQEVRVISVYATRWSLKWQSGGGEQQRVELGLLEEFYSMFHEQLPRALQRVEYEPEDVAFPPRMAGLEVTRARLWLFTLPSDQVVAALDLDFMNIDASSTINVLEHGTYGQIEINGKSLEQAIADLANDVAAKEIDTSTLLPPERHQIVFASHIGGGPKEIEETIALILYRSDPPYRPEFMEVRRPSGLNTEQKIGAVTPYVSLLSGHPEYVENSIFLTVVQAVGTSARFRQIWHRAHGRVRDFRYTGQKQEVGVQRKAAMEFLADELGNLVLDLSFSVEASADLGLLIPLLRIESFHKDLYAAMELRERAETVSRMFTRLDASIKSELTAIEIREQQGNEKRRLRRAAAISVLSVVAVPLSFLLTFFGINSVQVNENWSIFDWSHYLGVYVAAAGLAVFPLLVFLILNGRAWLHSRSDERERQRRIEKEAEPTMPFEPSVDGAAVANGHPRPRNLREVPKAQEDDTREAATG